MIYLVSKYIIQAKNAYCNYRVLAESESVEEFEREFHGLGKLRLRILIDPAVKLNRKVLVVRSSGMRLFHIASISRAISFTGILEIEGEKINEYFREMETMAHDKWEPKRHSNPKQAKEYFDELKDWVRKTVMDMGENSSDEEIVVEGLGGVLSDNESVRENQESDDKGENLNDLLGEIQINERAGNSKTKGRFFPSGSAPAASGKESDEPGVLDPDGEFDATRTLKGTRRRIKKHVHKGRIDKEGEDIIHKKGTDAPCDLKKVRMIKMGESKFRISIEIPYDIENGCMEIVTIGENGKSSGLRVDNASAVAGCSSAAAADDKIELKDMQANTKIKIDFSLFDTREYAMEVNVYEHN